jgi:glutamate/aspartate transport system substrate-binding protein
MHRSQSEPLMPLLACFVRPVAWGRGCIGLALLLVAGAAWAQARALQPPAVSATPPISERQSPTLQKLRATGVITLAHRENSVPFSYLDAGKQPVGYALELCQRVVQAIRTEYDLPNLRVQYLSVSAAERMPALLAGRADLECGNTTNTAARRKQVAFTMTHFFDGGRLLVRAQSGVQRLSDLRNRAIVVNKGATHASFLRGQIERGLLAARILEVKDAAEALMALRNNEAQAYLHDGMVLASLRASDSDPEQWAVVGDLISVEPLSIMLRKDDPEFKRIVDVTLSRLMISGEIRLIWRRWFESPIPPGGINVGVPMNLLMRDQVRFPSDKVGDELGG